MKQFNLDTWLKDKSHKVVTRDRKEVTIEKTDIHIHGMSHMILGKYSDSDIYEIWHSNGRINYTGSDCNLDLFFADEGDGLTELQKTLEEDCDCYVNLYNDGTTREELREWIKCWCNRIVDLVRNELEKSKPYSGNQKQEWSEEDEKLLNSAISLVYEVGDISLHSWLKSIKDRVQPQPKQEWSEEDEEDLKQAAKYLRVHATHVQGGNSKRYVLDLADRIEYLEPNHWKPSEEQMECLDKAIPLCIGEVGRDAILPLESLYDDLKKL